MESLISICVEDMKLTGKKSEKEIVNDGNKIIHDGNELNHASSKKKVTFADVVKGSTHNTMNGNLLVTKIGSTKTTNNKNRR